MQQKPIPTPDMDLTYNTIQDVRMMPGQRDLVIGWNKTNMGTYLVSDVNNVKHGGTQFRVQHWRNKDVFSEINDAVNGVKFTELWQRLSNWSDKQFGLPSSRGPIGPLKHALKEIQEELLAGNLYDIMEYANVLQLVLDASRRAGFTCHGLINAAQAKLEISENEPIQHIEVKE